MNDRQWLDNNLLVGYTSKRSPSWRYREGTNNFYYGKVPVEDVQERLFSWEPVKTPLEYRVEGVPFTSTTRCVIARSDSGADLGVFKIGYKPLSFSAWLEAIEEHTLGPQLSIGSAGLLREGAVGWVSIELPDNVITPEGVEFRPNLLAATSFDGSLATTFKRVVTEISCDNIISMGGDITRVRHTKKSPERIPNMQGAVHLVHAIAYDFSRTVSQMCAKTITPFDFDKILEVVAPISNRPDARTTISENKQDRLRQMWNTDERVTPWRGTAYGVCRLVSTYNQHEGIVRGRSRAERNMSNVLDFITESSDKWLRKMVMSI